MRTSMAIVLQVLARYALAIPAFSQQPATSARVTSSPSGHVPTPNAFTPKSCAEVRVAVADTHGRDAPKQTKTGCAV